MTGGQRFGECGLLRGVEGRLEALDRRTQDGERLAHRGHETLAPREARGRIALGRGGRRVVAQRAHRPGGLAAVAREGVPSAALGGGRLDLRFDIGEARGDPRVGVGAHALEHPLAAVAAIPTFGARLGHGESGCEKRQCGEGRNDELLHGGVVLSWVVDARVIAREWGGAMTGRFPGVTAGHGFVTRGYHRCGAWRPRDMIPVMTRTPHILVVDDDREIRRLVSRFLAENGFRTTEAKDAAEAELALAAGKFELVVLDLMMPGEDGLSFARRLRARDGMPIVMLTARGEETDRIVGLEIGADDYLPKPFNPRELLARIRAVLRRAADRPAPEAKPRSFRFAGWTLDSARRELRRPDGALVPTTDAELDLLVAFVERPQRTLSREQLLDLARGRQAQLFDRSIDVAVMRLRRKIEPDPAKPEIIRTVRNGGYLFAADVEAEA